MICRDNQQVILFQEPKQHAKIHIKFFNLTGIPLRISSMSPQRIKIHQIDKTQSMKLFLCNFDSLLHPMHRVFGFKSLRDTLSIKNVFNFSDGNHIQSGILQSIQRCFSEWLQRIIMTVAGSLKFTFLLSHIRSGNHSANFPLILHGDFSRNLTAAIKFLQTKGLLIAANLQHRICRCIHDHVSCRNFFLRKLLQNLRSACTFIADHFSSGSSFQLLDQLWRKSVF